MIFASYYPTSLADSPAGASVIVKAVVWLQDVLLGTVATSIAIIAVAAIGFGMLTGRIDVRRGVTVVMGCFILFGASSIVSGLRGVPDEPAEMVVAPNVQPPVTVVSPRPLPTSSAVPYDPYSGASVPLR